jgi:hypothetical protein
VSTYLGVYVWVSTCLGVWVSTCLGVYVLMCQGLSSDVVLNIEYPILNIKC